MGLREQAAADLQTILEDSAAGFGRAITVTNPAGVTADLTGFSTDVFQGIDPETGVMVSGRIASVALPIAALIAAGLGMPRGVSDETSDPWVVEFDDLRDVSHRFKVSEAYPDRALGIVTARLEKYQ